MPAFFVSRVKVHDKDKMEDYARRAGATLKAHGGEPILRGAFSHALLGADSSHGTGIVRFADMTALKAWFASPDYQALAPLRDAACEMTLLAYEAPA